MDDLISLVTHYMTGSFASIFIFGILTGWLIEWLFYNFFWKNRKKSHQTDEITEKSQEPAQDNAKNHEIVEQKVETSKNEQTTEQEVKQVAKQKKKAKPSKPDNLTKLLGVGPSMSKRLQDIGIKSFKQLSELSTEKLTEKLIAKGARINNKSIMESWAEQAKLADANDLDGLKALQKKLKK